MQIESGKNVAFENSTKRIKMSATSGFGTEIKKLEIGAFARNQPTTQTADTRAAFCDPSPIAPGVEMIMVRMTFPNKDLIPPSMAKVMREDDQLVDLFHAQKAYQLTGGNISDLDRLEMGRFREGRVDTADRQTMKNVANVHLGVLRRGLVNNGFGLVHVTCQVRRKPNQSAGQRQSYQNIVVLKFVRGAESQELPPEITSAIRAFAKISWNFLHVWDNTGIAKNMTINVVGPQRDQKPKRALVVRDQSFSVVEEETTEDNE